MAFQPIHAALTTFREVRIPADLPPDKRADFVKRIEAAVKKQAALADQSDAVLRLTGPVREEEGILHLEHELVSPFRLRRILDADERPDIQTLWWITIGALRAFAAAETKRQVHGGVQPRCLFVDRLGRIKVSDFGLASTFEALCGRDARRYIACEPVAEKEEAGRTSARWSQMNEDSEREDSWIAPFFAPEILAGDTYLNAAADQFALGVTLYLIATGVHPLGAELSNPELFGYFVPEPYLFEDERKDWADAFERQSAQTALSADQPVLDWAALVYRLLGNESGERFPNFVAALEEARKHAPAEWTEAERVLGESMDLLDQGQYDAFLTTIGPWSENEALPALWRQRLAECIAETERIKGESAARAAVEEQLQQGYQALDGGDIEQARAVADAVAAGLSEDDPLNTRVEDLRRLCDEHERHIRENAEALFQANIALARETLARGEFTEARMILTGVLDDPLTGAEHAREIEELLTELDEQARRFSRFQQEFEQAKTDYGAGKLTAALDRLEQILSDDDLPESLRGAIEEFAADLETEKRRHEEHLATIRAVEEALERGDAATAEETLAMLPFDTQDPHIIARRDELAAACEKLRGLSERLTALGQTLNSGEAEAALAGAETLLKEKPPAAIVAQANELAQHCRSVIEQLQKAQIGDAVEALTLAETAFQTGDVAQCRRRLGMVLPLAARLEGPDRARATQLERAVTRCEEALRSLETAERRLGQGDFEEAEAALDRIAAADLPAKYATKITELRAQAQAAREAHREQRAARLQTWLEQIAEHLERSEIERAEELLGQEEISADAGAELTRRYEMLRADALRGRKILETFAPIEKALRARQVEEAARRLEEARTGEADWPAWAVERAAQYQDRLKKAERERREEAARQAESELKQAAAALATGDADECDRHLAAAEPILKFAEALRPRYEEACRAVAELRRWLPKIAEVEAAARGDRPAEAERLVRDLLRQELPDVLRPRAEAVEKTILKRIAERRAELTRELESARQEIELRGRRAKSTPGRLAVIHDDVLATAEHKQTAAELLARFDALPQPKGRGLPIVIAAASAVIVLGAGLYFMKGSPPAPAPTPPEPVVQQPPVAPPAPAPTADDIIQAATSRLREALAQAREQLPADRRAPQWEIEFDPPNAFDTTLRAREAGGQALVLSEHLKEADVRALRWDPSWTERLFPPPAVVAAPPTEPPATPPSEPPPTESTPTPEQPAAEPAWPTALTVGVTEPPRADFLKLLLETIAPPSASTAVYPPLPVLAGILARVQIDEHDADNAVAVTFELANQAGSVSNTFPMEAHGATWTPTETNAGTLRTTLQDIVEQLQTHYAGLAEQLEHQYVTGDLLAAYRTYQQAQAAPNPRDLREIAESLERIAAVTRRMPPTWNPPDGFSASAEIDAATGYPLELNSNGQTLRLVNVPPSDPLWAGLAATGAGDTPADAPGRALVREAAQAPLERRWHLLYIGAADPTQPVNDDPRSAARRLPQCDIPSVEQWLLAALKFRDRNAEYGFIGGMWEWCTADDQLWVCGGCDVLHKRLLPWPDDLTELPRTWAWLNHPLVSQPRRWGDSLSGVRPVFVPR